MIRVGQLPSPTWNSLKVNQAVVEEELSIDAGAAFGRPGPSDLPAGVTLTQLTRGEAKERLARSAPDEPQEALIAGKKPIHHPQAFGTGLGAEFDAVLDRGEVPVQLLVADPGIRPAQPVLWDLDLADGAHAAQEQLIHVGRGADLTLILTCRSAPRAQGTALVSTKILLEPGAALHLIRTQILGRDVVFLDDTGAALMESAQLKMTQIALGAGKAYVGVQPELVGDRSAFDVRLYYLGMGERLLDFSYNAVHRGRRTQSHLLFDGVLGGRSQKTLRDTIDFRRGSSGSKGREEENVLVLSDDILNRSMPIILCEEEDVEGSHGATIGRLDDEVLFYLASRGIGADEAVRMMVRAKLAAAAGGIPDEALRAELLGRAEEEFES